MCFVVGDIVLVYILLGERRDNLSILFFVVCFLYTSLEYSILYLSICSVVFFLLLLLFLLLLAFPWRDKYVLFWFTYAVLISLNFSCEHLEVDDLSSFPAM